MSRNFLQSDEFRRDDQRFVEREDKRKAASPIIADSAYLNQPLRSYAEALADRLRMQEVPGVPAAPSRAHERSPQEAVSALRVSPANARGV